VVSGYALTFRLALAPAGRLGDQYGYKRLFLAGLSLFTLASVACGVSQNAGELIIARLVQGLGAGIYYPAISAIIQRLFTGKDHSRAFGWAGSWASRPRPGRCPGGLVQLAGVTDGWRWVFLVNLFIDPFAGRALDRAGQRQVLPLLAAVFAAALVSGHRLRRPRCPDRAGRRQQAASRGGGA
jgi:MFS family permease